MDDPEMVRVGDTLRYEVSPGLFYEYRVASLTGDGMVTLVGNFGPFRVRVAELKGLSWGLTVWPREGEVGDVLAEILGG